MAKYISILIVIFSLGLAQSRPDVVGTILSKGQRVPGVTVYLVNPALGQRSFAAVTDASGHFTLQSVPSPIDSPGWYIEVYWGQERIYVQPVVKSGQGLRGNNCGNNVVCLDDIQLR